MSVGIYEIDKVHFHFSIKYRWFDDMARGLKDEEYRLDTPYWESRLWNNETNEGLVFDEIWFTNGYGGDRPFMRRKCMGVYRGNVPSWNEEKGLDFLSMQPGFIVKLGDILEIRNFSL